MVGAMPQASVERHIDQGLVEKRVDQARCVTSSHSIVDLEFARKGIGQCRDGGPCAPKSLPNQQAGRVEGRVAPGDLTLRRSQNRA
jgi:hypothetical protein